MKEITFKLHFGRDVYNLSIYQDNIIRDENNNVVDLVELSKTKNRKFYIYLAKSDYIRIEIDGFCILGTYFKNNKMYNSTSGSIKMMYSFFSDMKNQNWF